MLQPPVRTAKRFSLLERDRAASWFAGTVTASPVSRPTWAGFRRQILHFLVTVSGLPMYQFRKEFFGAAKSTGVSAYSLLRRPCSPACRNGLRMVNTLFSWDAA